MRYRWVIAFVVLTSCSDLFAQKRTNFVYVDFSETKRLGDLKKKVGGLIKDIQQNGEEIILFMSNDNNPILVKDFQGIETALDKIYSMRPSIPDFFDEIDTINAVMSSESILSGLNTTGDNAKANESVNFYFFLNTEHANWYGQDKSFVDKILLTNRLLSQKGLKPHCRVTLYLDSYGDQSNRLYVDELKSKEYYEVYEY